MYTLEHHRMTPAFSSASLRGGALPMGHLLNVDHFHMSAPTFPPHPHAGFSAVTWMMPWSEGGFVNRDSRGDQSRIVPGSLHWTLAGSGIVHEEIPETPGQDCEGLQIFVKLPEPLELTAPRAFHLAPDALARVDVGGGSARVLVGAVNGVASPVPSHARTTMMIIDVRSECALEIPRGVEAVAIVLRGAGTIDGVEAGVDVAATLAAGQAHRIAGRELNVFVAWSEPMPATPTFAGPFCMFRRERLAAARGAYARGEMGRLAPSRARWLR